MFSTGAMGRIPVTLNRFYSGHFHKTVKYQNIFQLCWCNVTCHGERFSAYLEEAMRSVFVI